MFDIHSGWARLTVLVGLLFAATVALSLSPGTSARAADGACQDGAGVTVVVDFTELGGSIEAGCASGDPATGRAALLAARFTATDSQPGLLCAINSEPDPCPATFQGSFWSYWHSVPDGEWISYQVGADSSHPASGKLEGWRYNDGTVGPGITPAAVESTLRATPSVAPTGPAITDTVPDLQSSAAEAQNSALVFTTLGFAAAIVIVVILFVVRSRRRRATEK
ncbi:MAG: hypothetical protein ABIX09_07930 [Terrimesophilobacter sp.]